MNIKKIGLLSDTHSHWDDKYIEYFSGCDEIWHAGDIGSLEIITKLENKATLRAVYGNIDDHTIRTICPEKLIFNIDEVRIFMTHIGGYPGKYAKNVENILVKNNIDLFICGHSHILKVMYDKKINCMHMNPGAAGIYGFHQVRTILRFQIKGKYIENLEVIELNNSSL